MLCWRIEGWWWTPEALQIWPHTTQLTWSELLFKYIVFVLEKDHNQFWIVVSVFANQCPSVRNRFALSAVIWRARFDLQSCRGRVSKAASILTISVARCAICMPIVSRSTTLSTTLSFNCSCACVNSLPSGVTSSLSERSVVRWRTKFLKLFTQLLAAK